MLHHNDDDYEGKEHNVVGALQTPKMSLPHSRKGKSPPLPAFMVGRGVRPPLTTQERRPNQSPEAGKIELAAAVATALNNSERE